MNNAELEAVKIINKLILTLDYLELSALECAIAARRFNMRKAEGLKFKSIEEVK